MTLRIPHPKFLAPALIAAALGMAGCAENYGGEGAAAGGAAGAIIGAATGGDALAGAAIGAAAGAVGGSLIKKNDGYCYRRDRDGYEHRVSCN
ncbi:MAG: glycine zipper 2TM domain-containing protein [Sphingomonadales bacterium]|nr:glycine zipper 2TM domain-containing protein [Sphingomonadales bacterium]